MEAEQKRYSSLSCFSRIEPIKPLNDEFTLCKVYVAATGRNRNYSFISRSAMDAAMPTLSYIPVVGHLLPKLDEDGNEVGKYFGGHDYMFDENWNLVAQTVPFGVVLQDAFAYETVEEYGSSFEYLTTNAILWTGRYPELKEAVYSEDTWFGQSMEICVGQTRPYAEDSNYTEILEYSYSALCILGKSDEPEYHTEPCFISSRFVPVSYSLERDTFNQDMCEMREHLAFMLSPEKGGNVPMEMEKIESILGEFGLSAETAPFDFADMDENALRTAAQEYAAAGQRDSDDGDAHGDDKGGAEACFAATYRQRLDALRAALPDEEIRDGSGKWVSCTGYWIHDFDDQYVFVRRYTEYADREHSDEHGRFAYTFDEVAQSVTLNSEFEPMYVMWLTADEKQKLETSRNAFEQMQQELTDLRQYKLDAEKEQRKAAVDELFAQFDDLQSVEAFEALRSDAYESGEMSDIETQLFAMRGRHQTKSTAKSGKSSVKVGLIDDEPAKTAPYGGLLKKH